MVAVDRTEESMKNRFLVRTGEKEDLNQYWYSAPTIDAMVKEVVDNSKKCAFLSTPSIYYSLPKGSEVRDNSYCFDLDEQWAKDPHFVVYDFNKAEEIPKDLHGTFDCVVIDPPFITEEVWEKYTVAAKMLLQEGGKVIASTIQENAPMMKEKLGVEPQKFKPSIPHLVYQYALYTNYPAEHLSVPNPEVPDYDD